MATLLNHCQTEGQDKSTHPLTPDYFLVLTIPYNDEQDEMFSIFLLLI